MHWSRYLESGSGYQKHDLDGTKHPQEIQGAWRGAAPPIFHKFIHGELEGRSPSKTFHSRPGTKYRSEICYRLY